VSAGPRGPTLGVALLALAACGLPEPETLPRVLGASPSGAGVPTGAEAAVWFSVPADAAGLLDGRRLVLVEAARLREAEDAVERDEGAAGVGIPVRATLEEGGARVRLVPAGPLRGFTGHALVLSSRARAADGRPMLDPEGRRRTFVARFETGAPPGPPPAPVLTEVRVRAATPEAGGEYVEVANLGAGPLDLMGWRLSKRTLSGALASCTISAPAGAGVLAPGGVAIVAGGAWDGRYALPAGVPVLACGATALLGGLADDRAADVLLADPVGEVRSTLGERGAPVCPTAVERIDPAGPDESWNLVCAGGSPGEV
jgi:hypothetical protein